MHGYVSVAAVVLCFIAFLASSQSPELNENDIVGNPISYGLVMVDHDISAHINLLYDNSIDNSNDFGFVGSGMIGGVVWNDTRFVNMEHKEDGIRDDDEMAVPNVDIWLYNFTTGNFIRNVTSNVTGDYIFKGLFAGSYIVKAECNPRLDISLWGPTVTGNNSHDCSGTLVVLQQDNSFNMTIDFGYRNFS